MTLSVGVIGCGTISGIYFRNAALFKDIAINACADIRSEVAEQVAAEHRIEALSAEALIASPTIDIVLNLTPPEMHKDVSLAALHAGKHVYSEKPLATALADGLEIREAGLQRGLRVGAAPDTVLGGNVQLAASQLDAGLIGRPLLGTAAVLSHGMEHWHPSPAFLFAPGGGPILDLGPYYIAALATLLGPVASVMAMAQTGFDERIISAPDSALRGQVIAVTTPTTYQALLQFRSGAQISLAASWDVWGHSLPPIELHGTEGSIRLDDPNWFGGPVHHAGHDGVWHEQSSAERVFGRVNWSRGAFRAANFRGLGLAEMAHAIKAGVPHQASGELAVHVLAVLAGIMDAASSGAAVAIDTPPFVAPRLCETDAASLLA